MKHIDNAHFHLKDTAIALGKFDGIHKGHQLLIDEIVRRAAGTGMSSVVFTFDRPPQAALHQDRRFLQLFTRQEKREILEKKGVDIMIEHPFTRSFSSLSASDFIRQILVEKTGARVIVVGEDFRFGKNRAGSVEDLREHADELGYELVVFKKLLMDGEAVSSTRIRKCLNESDMEKVDSLLGRPFSLTGKVIKGKQLGRKIHFPTINQTPESDKMLPGNGVYISRLDIGNEKYFGVTNIGVKPTVKSDKIRNVETYILDYSGDLYEKEIRLELLHFIRKEMKFSSLDHLQEQLKLDVDFSRKYVHDTFRLR